MLRKVQFHGPLADELGDQVFRFRVDTPQQWFAACSSQVKGFRKAIREYPTGSIVLRNSKTKETKQVSMQTLTMNFGDYDEVHVLPETKGGWEAALWVASYVGASGAAYYVVAVIVFIAITYAISAAMQALAPSPDTAEGAERPNERPSRLYNGPVNVVQQGYPVPLVYGIHMTGSVVISAGVRVEDIEYVPPPAPVEVPPEDWQWTGGGGGGDGP